LTKASETAINKILSMTIGYHVRDQVPLEGIVRPVYVQLPDRDAKVVKVAAGKAWAFGQDHLCEGRFK